MPKKSQLQSETLVYALAIVIVGVVLVLGYRFITTSSSRGEQVSQIQLKNSIQNSVSTLSSDYGSVKVKTFNVPTKYNELCFTSTKNSNELPKAFVEKNPIAADAVETGKNAFLLGDDFDSFTVGDLKLPNKVTCIPAVNGKISLKIEGKGDSSLVSAVESVASVVNVPEGLVKEDIAIASSDYAAELQIPAGTNIDYPSGAEEKVVVNKVSAPSTGSLAIAGDVYDFKPDGTKFNQPVPITLPYDPDKVSEPNELKIYYYDGSNWVQLESSFDVDENRNIVTGYTSHFTDLAVATNCFFVDGFCSFNCVFINVYDPDCCNTPVKCGDKNVELYCTRFGRPLACPQQQCTDSDGGIEYYVKGVIDGLSGSGKKGRTEDSCSNLVDGKSSTLDEHYCSGDVIKGTTYNCPFGCFDGACLAQNQTGIISEKECYDSDGKDFYNRGVVKWNRYAYEDLCHDISTLIEFYCDSEGAGKVIISCPCEKGACLTPPEEGFITNATVVAINATPVIGNVTIKKDTSGEATACNVYVDYKNNPNRYAVWDGRCEGKLQAPNSSGIGQGCCELDCGASAACDERFPVGACSGCNAEKFEEDLSGPATDCNVNVPYKGNERRYAEWFGNCTGKLQTPNTKGIGQGCCELACGASKFCDEHSPTGECGNCGVLTPLK